MNYNAGDNASSTLRSYSWPQVSTEGAEGADGRTGDGPRPGRRSLPGLPPVLPSVLPRLPSARSLLSPRGVLPTDTVSHGQPREDRVVREAGGTSRPGNLHVQTFWPLKQIMKKYRNTHISDCVDTAPCTQPSGPGDAALRPTRGPRPRRPFPHLTCPQHCVWLPGGTRVWKLLRLRDRPPKSLKTRAPGEHTSSPGDGPGGVLLCLVM